MIPRDLKSNFSLKLAYVAAVLVTRQTEANPFLAGLPVIKVPQGSALSCWHGYTFLQVHRRPITSPTIMSIALGSKCLDSLLHLKVVMLQEVGGKPDRYRHSRLPC